MKKLKEWALENLADFVKAEGELVSDEQAQARINVCKGCKFYGTVEPLPGLKTEGCTLCGCPSLTKPHMRTIRRAKSAPDKPVTIAEILRLKTEGKYNPDNFFSQLITCPHPEGNKWEDVDKQFL